MKPAHSVERERTFRAFFDAELAYVLRALRRLGATERDAEDLAQDVFLHAYRHWDERDPARPSRPWLFAFAVRITANYRRLARHRHERRALPSDRGGEHPEAQLGDRDLLLCALDRLPHERRVAIVMHDLEGWNAPEIARELGAPLNTIYSRLRVGRAELEQAVVELDQETSACTGGRT